MNKVLLFTVVCLLCILKINAQNPALTVNDWVLTELNVNGTITLPSGIVYLGTQDVVLQFTDTGTDYNFDTYVCSNEAIAGTVSYPFAGTTTEQFTLLSSAQTLGMCCNPQVDITMPPDPDCVALLGFSADYFMFWNGQLNTNYDYVINSIANTVELRVTKPNGDFALYGNATMSIDNIPSRLDITLAENPVNNKLLLTGNQVSDITAISIFDMNGKKVLNNISYQNGIDISHLGKGIFFLSVSSINSDKMIKFIKE